MKLYPLIGIFLLCICTCFSQPNEQGFYGIVVDKNGSAVSDVLISVNWRKRGLLSKADGSFYIMAQRQDTLVFRHTSFEPKAIALQNQTSDTLKIQLTERTLILDEVTVTNWGEWKDFKDKIAEMNADSIRNTDAYRLKMMFANLPNYEGKPNLPPLPSFSGVGFGVSFSISTKSTEYASTEERKKNQELANNAHRYSTDKLSKILKIKGQKLKDFKLYCDYFINFEQDDYKMIAQIQSLYQEWSQMEVYKKDSVTVKKQ
ncbi:MAG: carboxypeptidase-like regulatory domain-containing protein [Flavobacteriaceae bacterium]|nr:carboxypeptidase-like regulatory domain-containing protein [Flavobacteriaceae bacterium]